MARVRLSDPAPTSPVEAPPLPNYFDVEVAMFRAGVDLAIKSGMFSSSFPLSAPGLVEPVESPGSPEAG